MRPDSVWVPLDPKASLDATWETKLLGAVVRDFTRPNNRKPDDPSIYYRDLTDPIVNTDLTDFVLNNDNNGTINIDAKFTELFGANLVNTATTKINLSSKIVKLRRLDQDGDFWDTVKEDASLQKVLPTWIKKARKKGNPDVCLIVGIAIGEDVDVEWDQTRIARRELNGDLALDKIITVAAGSPLPIPVGVDLGLTVAKEDTKVRIFRAKQPNKTIFALELKVVESKGWKWGTKTFELGRGPSSEQELGEGSEDEEEEVEMEDVVLYDPKVLVHWGPGAAGNPSGN